MKQAFFCIPFLLFLFFNVSGKSNAVSNKSFHVSDSLGIKFRIVKVLPIGWGTVYRIVMTEKTKSAQALLNDTTNLYISIDKKLSGKLKLHNLKVNKVYFAQFINTHKLTEKNYMPAGASGFLSKNKEIWKLKSMIAMDKDVKKITIKGQALNAKLGAIVQGENEEFYIDGLDEWPDDITGKTVVVTGYVRSEYHDPKNLKTKDGLHKTGMSGYKNSLSEAKWKVID